MNMIEANTLRRLLALDAACAAAESMVGVHPDIRAALTLLQDAIDTHGGVEHVYPIWGDMLAAQYDAVVWLKNNPVVFGCDPDSPTSE